MTLKRDVIRDELMGNGMSVDLAVMGIRNHPVRGIWKHGTVAGVARLQNDPLSLNSCESSYGNCLSLNSCESSYGNSLSLNSCESSYGN